VNWQIVEANGKPFVVYQAAAYRTPDDLRPGHGIAWEPIPGPTPYTKDSELMNAETAAWGRAIVALGLAANRKIASKQEVLARQGNRDAPAPAPAPAVLDDGSVAEVLQSISRTRPTTEELRTKLVSMGIPSVPEGQITRGTIQRLSPKQAVDLVAWLDSRVLA
jgi:hypothetical protein